AIEIDEKPAATGPAKVARRVSINEHTVKVTKPGFEPFSRKIDVHSSETVRLEIKLEPEKQTGTLVVREADGDDVRVLLDGADAGPAPLERELDPGDHTIELEGPKHHADTRTL